MLIDTYVSDSLTVQYKNYKSFINLVIHNPPPRGRNKGKIFDRTYIYQFAKINMVPWFMPREKL